MNDNFFDLKPESSEPEGFSTAREYDTVPPSSYHSVLEENLLLRRICCGNTESGTVVFTKDGKIFFSTLTKEDTPLAKYLESHLQDFAKSEKFKLTRQCEGYRYRISARTVSALNDTYYVFYISRRLPDAPNHQQGIHYCDRESLQQEVSHVLFPVPGVEGYYSDGIQQALSKKIPVLIFGETGVGKRHLALLIYLSGPYAANPIVVIDFTLINRQSWAFLMGKGDSPLWDTDVTLVFKDIQVLEPDRLTQLLSFIKESQTGLRNRLIFTCSLPEAEFNSPSLQATVLRLPCLTIHMGPLRGQYSIIRRTVSELLTGFRNPGDPVKDFFTPEAMSLLVNYAWPQNYRQLYRVVDKLLILCEGKTITEDMVREALITEDHLIYGPAKKVAEHSILDLTQTMEEINSAIIQIILEQNGGNQALAARSLGISRTTMWRMMKAAALKEEAKEAVGEPGKQTAK